MTRSSESASKKPCRASVLQTPGTGFACGRRRLQDRRLTQTDPFSTPSEEATAGKPEALARPRPITTFRLGRIKAAVGENKAEERKFYNVTCSRSYLDEEKHFHDANSFGRDDLPLVARARR